MKLFFTLLPLVLAVPAFLGAYTHHLHMFQLNSYHYDVESKWLLRNLKQVLFLLLPCALGYVSLELAPEFLGEKGVYVYGPLLTVIFAFIALWFKWKKMTVKAKKPLVYTDRVKRLTLTSGLLFLLVTFGLFLILGAVLKDYIRAGVWALRFASGIIAVTPVYILLCDLINKPVEKGIKRKYTNEAKALLAANRNLKIIGITGSYGKTSVKYFLSTLLEAKYNVLMTPENYNTPMGVVRTVREHLSPLHEVFVCEMGAKRVGEIRELCDLVHPQSGVITSVGPQHLDTFGSQERVRKTKFELARALPKSGKVYLNADSEELMKEDYDGAKVYYSLTGKGDYNGEDVHTDVHGTSFTLVHGDERFSFKTPIIGRHNVLNIVGAIAVAHEMGIPYEALAPQVRKLQSVPHRQQLIDRGDCAIIDDAYNSNPSGAKSALDTLSMFDGCRILVTPGMVELGEKMEECNKTFGVQAASSCDFAILVGRKQAVPIKAGLLEGGFPEEKIYVAENFTEAIGYAYKLPTGGRKPVILMENDLPDNF